MITALQAPMAEAKISAVRPAQCVRIATARSVIDTVFPRNAPKEVNFARSPVRMLTAILFDMLRAGKKPLGYIRRQLKDKKLLLGGDTMATVFDVANYFLTQSDEEAGDLISNLKLQKLVYYAQGFHLAVYGRPLFDNVIEAWQHGPVAPDLYHAHKHHGSAAIPAPVNADFSMLSDEQRELLDEVYAVYGQFSGWKLRNMTHEEAPWKDVADGFNVTITPEAMAEFFATRLTS